MKHLPQVIAWELTRRCTLQCRHCRGAAHDKDYAGEFTTEECFKTVDALVKQSSCGRHGSRPSMGKDEQFRSGSGGSGSVPTVSPSGAHKAPLIILTGGEPLMRDDIYSIAKYAAHNGCRVVLATCGHLLSQQTVEELKANGVMAVSVSLDAATPTAHDEFRGVHGAYEKTMEGIGHLRSAGMPFQINTTVSKLNVKDLPLILEQAVAMGAATMDFFFLVPAGRGAELADLALDPDARDEALRWIAEQERRAPLRIKTTCAPQYRHFRQVDDQARSLPPFRGCMGGRGFVFISHIGELQPCGFLDLPCGNLRSADFDFARLYEESEVFQQMRKLDPFGECPARLGFWASAFGTTRRR